MKADEYMVLQMAVEEGVSSGFATIADYAADDSFCEAKMVDSVMNAILAWFHIERPWLRDSDT